MRKEQWLEGWSKRGERAPVDLEAVIVRADGRSLAVRLANISSQGCQIICGETLPIGEILTVSCPEVGEVRAQVRWSLGDRAGTFFCNDGEESDETGHLTA